MPWQLIISIAIQVVSALLTEPFQPENATSGETEATTVDASSPVPVLFGTRLMAQPNCVWFGDIKTTPIISCSGGKK